MLTYTKSMTLQEWVEILVHKSDVLSSMPNGGSVNKIPGKNLCLSRLTDYNLNDVVGQNVAGPEHNYSFLGAIFNSLNSHFYLCVRPNIL